MHLPADWNDESHSKLWAYNLHYFEDLLADNAQGKQAFHIELLNKWIDQNPVGHGNGWEPYPLSLRISNVLKAWQAGLPLEQRHFESLYAQASFLSKDLERHLLGNHYFVNLKALLFAGVLLNNKRWLTIATKGLLQEIPEQTLDDGANFELSPMYHALILVDMLDMYNLCQAYQDSVSSDLLNILAHYLPKMLSFMELMSHNDGGVSFFNDSVDGIAPTKQRIICYALRLGFEFQPMNIDVAQTIDSNPSGYMVATHSSSKLIFDAANVGPDYIPGHAHADTLSFELSIGLERVFVNSGTSQYGLGEKRLTERKTVSHNTVEVDQTDSSQVWSGFRVAKRARVLNRNCQVVDNRVELSAAHNGFKKIFNGPIHQRALTLTNNTLKVTDTLTGRFNQAVARFYIHPAIDVKLKENLLMLKGEAFELIADITELHIALVDSTWHPGFGLSLNNKCLEVWFTTSESTIEFKWTEK
ncbi:hypothetical protein GCM10009123_01520 [Kangiella japonica]|uniref:Heparinase n=1 Tax=Kangiella japonica TaxID=647384 RepID=A0ABN0STD3_9GAMM